MNALVISRILQKGKCQLAVENAFISSDEEGIVVFEKNSRESYVAPFNEFFFESKVSEKPFSC